MADTRLMTGQTLGAEICDALGLQKNRVRSLTIHCEMNQAATVLVEQYVENDQGQRTATVMVESYELVRKDSDGIWERNQIGIAGEDVRAWEAEA